MVLKLSSSGAPVLFGEAENELVCIIWCWCHWVLGVICYIYLSQHLYSYKPKGLSCFDKCSIIGRFTVFCLLADVHDEPECSTVSSIKPRHLFSPPRRLCFWLNFFYQQNHKKTTGSIFMKLGLAWLKKHPLNFLDDLESRGRYPKYFSGSPCILTPSTWKWSSIVT